MNVLFDELKEAIQRNRLANPHYGKHNDINTIQIDSNIRINDLFDRQIDMVVKECLIAEHRENHKEPT